MWVEFALKFHAIAEKSAKYLRYLLPHPVKLKRKRNNLKFKTWELQVAYSKQMLSFLMFDDTNYCVSRPKFVDYKIWTPKVLLYWYELNHTDRSILTICYYAEILSLLSFAHQFAPTLYRVVQKSKPLSSIIIKSY